MPEAAVNEKKFFPAVAIVAVVIVTAVVLRVYGTWKERRKIMAEITLKSKTFTVEVADTEKKREKGLGERDGMAADHGMYFPFGSAQYWIFWMKGMRFPIDIVWIHDGKVVDIDPSVPLPKTEPLETYSPSEPADAVLELNAGAAAALELRPGDSAQIRALAP